MPVFTVLAGVSEMETIWTESTEAALAEQNWQRSERERHQRLLHQLKLECQQVRARERKTAVTPAGATPTVISPIVPKEVLSTTPAEPPALAGEPARQERVFHHPKKTVLSVQIC